MNLGEDMTYDFPLIKTVKKTSQLVWHRIYSYRSRTKFKVSLDVSSKTQDVRGWHSVPRQAWLRQVNHA